MSFPFQSKTNHLNGKKPHLEIVTNPQSAYDYTPEQPPYFDEIPTVQNGTNDSVAIFRERFLWRRASESAKNYATSLMPSAAPIRPSSSGLFRTQQLHNSLPKMT